MSVPGSRRVERERELRPGRCGGRCGRCGRWGRSGRCLRYRGVRAADVRGLETYALTVGYAPRTGAISSGCQSWPRRGATLLVSPRLNFDRPVRA